jgi:putative tryptophan/tyrosine transport system substrate-binding protein
MRRREFIALISGAATVWPFGARAQQTEQKRRIGVLNSLAETDAEPQAWDAAFRKRLNELGWIEGRNIQLDYRWAAGKVERLQEFAKELIGLKPDVLVAMTTPATAALHARTRTIPIVFAVVADPIGSGFVANLAMPDGNITGFADYEPSLSGKWLGLMREVAPSVSRVGFLFNPQTAPFARPYLATFHSAASALAVEPIETPFHSAAEIEAMMIKLGREGGAGVIVLPDTSTVIYRETILSLADRYRLPTVYPFRLFVTAGGLISYGIDLANQLRGASSYVDRILRGAKPSELPVQQPTKFELIINLKTAKALALSIPPSLLATADEVIEE